MNELTEAYLEIYDEFIPLSKEKEKRVEKRAKELASGVMDNAQNVKSLKKRPFSRFRPGIKRQIVSNVKSAKHKAALVQNASDAIIRSSVDRQAKNLAKQNELKKKLGDLTGMNNIRRLAREELEYIIESLIDNGYADDYESAVSIIEAMSDEWYYQILDEAPYQIYGPDPHGPSDSEPGPIGKPYKNKKRAKNRADKLDQEIGGYRHSVRYVEG